MTSADIRRYHYKTHMTNGAGFQWIRNREARKHTLLKTVIRPPRLWR